MFAVFDLFISMTLICFVVVLFYFPSFPGFISLFLFPCPRGSHQDRLIALPFFLLARDPFSVFRRRVKGSFPPRAKWANFFHNEADLRNSTCSCWTPERKVPDINVARSYSYVHGSVQRGG